MKLALWIPKIQLPRLDAELVWELGWAAVLIALAIWIASEAAVVPVTF